MTKSESRMQLPEDMENIVKAFALPYRDPKSHKTHKEVMNQLKWLCEDLVTNEYVQNQKGFHRLLISRVKNFEWMWSAMSEPPGTFGPLSPGLVRKGEW